MRRATWLAAIGLAVSFTIPSIVEAKDERRVDPQAEELKGRLSMGVQDVGSLQRALMLHRVALAQKGRRPVGRTKSAFADERDGRGSRAQRARFVVEQVVRPVHDWVKSIVARWETGGTIRRSKIAHVIGRKAKHAADAEKREEAKRSKRPDEPDEDIRALLRNK
jgi:hypothetical protein